MIDRHGDILDSDGDGDDDDDGDDSYHLSSALRHYDGW